MILIFSLLERNCQKKDKLFREKWTRHFLHFFTTFPFSLSLYPSHPPAPSLPLSLCLFLSVTLSPTFLSPLSSYLSLSFTHSLYLSLSLYLGNDQKGTNKLSFLSNGLFSLILKLFKDYIRVPSHKNIVRSPNWWFICVTFKWLSYSALKLSWNILKEHFRWKISALNFHLANFVVKSG